MTFLKNSDFGRLLVTLWLSKFKDDMVFEVEALMEEDAPMVLIRTKPWMSSAVIISKNSDLLSELMCS